jgi:hypothetical protein
MDVPVSVVIDSCAEVREADVGRVVEIELHTKLASPSPETTRAEVTCAGDTLEIRVDDPLTRKHLTRRVPLAAFGSSTKSRLLGLAIVELVSASWTELEADKPPVVEPIGPPPNPRVREEVREVLRLRLPPTPPRWRASLIGGMGYESSGLGPAWGGGARLRHPFTSAIGLASEIFFEGGSRDDPRGEISSQKASLAAYATWYLDFGDVHRLELGIGARGGYLQLSGSPADRNVLNGSSFSSIWGGPELLASFSSRVAGPLFLEVSGAMGYSTIPVRALADGARVASIDGAWLRPALGAGMEF